MADQTICIQTHLKIIKKKDWLTGKVTTNKVSDRQSYRSKSTYNNYMTKKFIRFKID